MTGLRVLVRVKALLYLAQLCRGKVVEALGSSLHGRGVGCVGLSSPTFLREYLLM